MNAYLREICGGDFSAKDFRTWAGTVACARELEALGAAATQAAAKQNVTLACAAAAKRLGNTPAVCRKAYVHPTIIETYLDDHHLTLPKPRTTAATRGLDDDERSVYAFLNAAQKATRTKKRSRVA